MRSDAEVKPPPDDHLLWERMRQGEAHALSVLFHEHYALLYDFGMKLTRQQELVKDGIQEVFAYIWERRRDVAAVESVRAYLLVCLRRHLLKVLTRQRQQEAYYERFDGEGQAEHFSPEDLLVIREKEEADRRALKEALLEISPRRREALYLKTYDGLTYREIALIMNITPQVARNYVAEAFQRLREIFSALKNNVQS